MNNDDYDDVDDYDVDDDDIDDDDIDDDDIDDDDIDDDCDGKDGDDGRPCSRHIRRRVTWQDMTSLNQKSPNSFHILPHTEYDDVNHNNIASCHAKSKHHI